MGGEQTDAISSFVPGSGTPELVLDLRDEIALSGLGSKEGLLGLEFSRDDSRSL